MVAKEYRVRMREESDQWHFHTAFGAGVIARLERADKTADAGSSFEF